MTDPYEIIILQKLVYLTDKILITWDIKNRKQYSIPYTSSEKFFIKILNIKIKEKYWVRWESYITWQFEMITAFLDEINTSRGRVSMHLVGVQTKFSSD